MANSLIQMAYSLIHLAYITIMAPSVSQFAHHDAHGELVVQAEHKVVSSRGVPHVLPLDVDLPSLGERCEDCTIADREDREDLERLIHVEAGGAGHRELVTPRLSCLSAACRRQHLVR